MAEQQVKISNSVYESTRSDSIEEVFNSAVSIVRNLPKDGPIKPSNDTKLKFYAYYKQAIDGPNTTPKPNFIIGPTDWYKWNAWYKLGDMSKHEAMLAYIEELRMSINIVTKETAANPEESEILRNGKGNKFYEYCKNIPHHTRIT